MKQIAVLGEGAWGTAIATILAGNGHTIHLWCHDETVAEGIRKNHTNNKCFATIPLHSQIIPTTDIAACIQDASVVFEAIPVKYLRSVLEQAQHLFSPEQVWVILSKGIEHHTLKLPSQIVDDVFGATAKKVVISGPSFAHDVMNKQPTMVVITGTDKKAIAHVQQLMANDFFKLSYSPDLIGVQIGGALKNVVALGIGMLDGAGYTDNAKAFFVTEGLREIAVVAQKLGGNHETVYGLSGVGDMILTAFGKHSKNYAVGRQFGGGSHVQINANESEAMPEGINTVQSAVQLAKKYSLELSLINGIYQVIFEHKKIDDVLKNLINVS